MHKIVIYPFEISYKKCFQHGIIDGMTCSEICNLNKIFWDQLSKYSLDGKVYLHAISIPLRMIEVVYMGLCFRIPCSCIDLNNSDDYVKYFILNLF